jgi:ribosomal-protein-alanine N-acetyltransferase
MPDQLPYIVEPMTLDDLDRVMEIERLSFSAPWPARSYRFEITENQHSTMLVVRPAPRLGSKPAHWLSRFQRVRRGTVFGYGGFWLLVDDAHIATIAVHPTWRDRGLGQLLLLSLLDHAIKLGARRATLEVRVSNLAAQGLYHKIGFEVVSLRKRYYADNNEDAYIMATPPFQTPKFQTNLQQSRARLYARLEAEIRSNPEEIAQTPGDELVRQNPSHGVKSENTA